MNNNKKMLNKFATYGLHNDIEGVALRTWNRCQTLMNIHNDLGSAYAEMYLDKLDEAARVQVKVMFGLIANLGIDEVRRQVIKG